MREPTVADIRRQIREIERRLRAEAKTASRERAWRRGGGRSLDRGAGLRVAWASVGERRRRRALRAPRVRSARLLTSFGGAPRGGGDVGLGGLRDGD
jgi:hypothetical protein